MPHIFVPGTPLFPEAVEEAGAHAQPQRRGSLAAMHDKKRRPRGRAPDRPSYESRRAGARAETPLEPQ